MYYRNFLADDHCVLLNYCTVIPSRNAVVTPLRKAASYEQRKANLGNQNFRRRIIT